MENFRQDTGISPKARALAAQQLRLWTEPELLKVGVEKMRNSNAEWDFMARSFLVWSLANMSLRDPESRTTYLRTMDQIIDETLQLEKEKGMYFFLMSYAKPDQYVVQPPHSLFVDGEIALMLAARRMVEEKTEYKRLLTERVDAMANRLRESPHLILESYPDECWTFDHCVALDAMKMADCLDGSDHSALIRDWVAMAREKLTDPRSGLLVASFTTTGAPLSGPQGSTLWMAAHCL
ncbi:MAG: hypothetical protein JF609_10935, partial [Verrucomicrobia bacterium]|nr:hypothetical protein [Verrucomicrobiota bacterium]